jgi:hypothetical protein
MTNVFGKYIIPKMNQDQGRMNSKPFSIIPGGDIKKGIG